LEYPQDDFPFYNGKPIALTATQWIVILLSVAVGFGVLIAPVPFFTGNFAQFIPAFLFVFIPLCGLALVAPHYWAAIFRKVTIKDIKWMFGFALLNILVTFLVGFLVYETVGANSNPVNSNLAALSVLERILFFLKIIPQLMGEEIITILPFLALMALFYRRFNLTRKRSILFAWLISSILFGLYHLHTYDWNLIQCVLVIGSARLILTLPYIMTKNIWVSTGTHIINDWILFGVSLMGAIAAK